jgi:hypothetical protein
MQNKKLNVKDMNIKILVVLFLLLASFDLFSQETTTVDNTELQVEIKTSNVITLNTNFILPITRFNFYKKTTNNEYGKLQMFNSIGAGIGFNYGSLTETMEIGSKNDKIEQKFANAIGIQFGILFAMDSQNGEPKNVFAPTVAISILDFQIGYGYELGTKEDNISGHFVTISYGIPIQKLTKKGTLILTEWVKTETTKMRIY